MREIKFRVWLPDYDIMEYGIELFYSHMIELEDRKQIWVSEENKEAMQFTGLKDVNGKEIYEGDILKENKNIYTVEWNEESAIFQLFQEPFLRCSMNPANELEVIGNIHENPELL